LATGPPYQGGQHAPHGVGCKLVNMVRVNVLTALLDLLSLLVLSVLIVRTVPAGRTRLLLLAATSTLLCGFGWVSQLLIELVIAGDWSGLRYVTSAFADQGSQLLLPVVGNGLFPGVATSLALGRSKTTARAFLLTAAAAAGGLALVDATIYIEAHQRYSGLLRSFAFDAVGGCIVSVALLLLRFVLRSRRLAFVLGVALSIVGLVYWFWVEHPYQQVRLVCQKWGTVQYEYARENLCCPQQAWTPLDWEPLFLRSLDGEYTLEIGGQLGGAMKASAGKPHVRVVGLFTKGPGADLPSWEKHLEFELLNRDLASGRVRLRQPPYDLNVRVAPQEGTKSQLIFAVDAGQPLVVSNWHGASPSFPLPSWFDLLGPWFGLAARTSGAGFRLTASSIARLQLEPHGSLPKAPAATEGAITFSIENGPRWEWTTHLGGLSRLSRELAEYYLRAVAVDVYVVSGRTVSVVLPGIASVSGVRGTWQFTDVLHRIGGRGGLDGSSPIRDLSVTGAAGDLRVGSGAHALVENDDLVVEGAELFIRNKGKSGFEVEGKARHILLNGTDLSSSRWASASTWLGPLLQILAALGGIGALMKWGKLLRKKLR